MWFVRFDSLINLLSLYYLRKNADNKDFFNTFVCRLIKNGLW